MTKHEISPRILVVDDNADNLKIIARILAPDYQVQVATGGEAALDLLNRSALPDLILLDVIMPDMDGFETCRRIREYADASTVPVIFLTAHEDSENIVTAFDCGGNDYVIKPFVPVVLLARIRLQIQLLKASHRQNKLLKNLQHANEELRFLSNTDGLLKIANRRYFDRMLKKEWQRGIRSRQHLSLLMIDVDFFKRYNDTYGHLAGDDCLKRVAQAVSRTLSRASDLVARYGGEEIVVILPDTPLDGAHKVAEAIRDAVLAQQIPHARSETGAFLTVSIGIACMVPELESSSDVLVTAADNALYRAKADGRNRVACEKRNSP